MEMEFRIGQSLTFGFEVGGGHVPTTPAGIITDVMFNVPGVVFGTVKEMEAVQDGN